MMKYEGFLELMRYRRSIRKFKPDPIPNGTIKKILDAARHSMSGGNSQPWEFIIVRDPNQKKKVFNSYLKCWEDVYYLEQQRIPKYRLSKFNVPPQEKEKAKATSAGWESAPVYIIVLADPRKQIGSILAEGPGIPSSPVLMRTMGHLSMAIQLAAASLGLGSMRVDVGHQQPFREALGIPEPVFVDAIVPVGYRGYEPGPPHRLPLEPMIHYDRYDMRKYLKPENILSYNEKIRELGSVKLSSHLMRSPHFL